MEFEAEFSKMIGELEQQSTWLHSLSWIALATMQTAQCTPGCSNPNPPQAAHTAVRTFHLVLPIASKSPCES
jgi:hypothetical protein